MTTKHVDTTPNTTLKSDQEMLDDAYLLLGIPLHHSKSNVLQGHPRTDQTESEIVLAARAISQLSSSFPSIMSTTTSTDYNIAVGEDMDVDLIASPVINNNMMMETSPSQHFSSEEDDNQVFKMEGIVPGSSAKRTRSQRNPVMFPLEYSDTRGALPRTSPLPVPIPQSSQSIPATTRSKTRSNHRRKQNHLEHLDEESDMLISSPETKSYTTSSSLRSRSNSTNRKKSSPMIINSLLVNHSDLHLSHSLPTTMPSSLKNVTGAIASVRTPSTGSSGSGGKATSGRVCSYCEATTTPMWRHGPPGYPDLCNKCGVKYMRGRILQDVNKQVSGLSRNQVKLK